MVPGKTSPAEYKAAVRCVALRLRASLEAVTGHRGPATPILPPYSGPSRYGLDKPEPADRSERRPTSTAPARAGCRDLRSGQKKACGAVEQKKAKSPHLTFKTPYKERDRLYAQPGRWGLYL